MLNERYILQNILLKQVLVFLSDSKQKLTFAQSLSKTQHTFMKTATQVSMGSRWNWALGKKINNTTNTCSSSQNIYSWSTILVIFLPIVHLMPMLICLPILVLYTKYLSKF